MDTTVFHVDKAGTLTEMPAEPHAKEDDLQALIALHRDLLRLVAGPSGRLVLVRREVGVDDGETTGRWSLDHLFIDGEGVPVLVEVKRSADTRARREVVAQMLDYAANGVAYWPVERLRATFSAGHDEPDEALRDALGIDDADAFWRIVGTNLSGGRIRMVFVADRIAPELKRIVEFLNEQMRPAEMLALEIARYAAASGSEILVPRLVGETARAHGIKGGAIPDPRPSNETEFLDMIANRWGPDAREGAVNLASRLRLLGLDVGLTQSTDALWVRFLIGRRPVWPTFLRRSKPQAEIALQYLAAWDPFRDEAARVTLAERLRQVDPAGFIWSGRTTGYPAIPLASCRNDEVAAALAATIGDIRDRVAQAAAGAGPPVV